MTLSELSIEYRRSADMLRGRIAELERERTGDPSETEKFRLGERIRNLRAMCYDASCAAVALEQYYDRRCPRHKYFSI